MRFDATLSREEAAPKPSPEPVMLICGRLSVEPARCLMVGDFLYDMQAAERAGSMTMLVESPHRDKFEYEADFEVSNLHEALEIIRWMADGAEKNDE